MIRFAIILALVLFDQNCMAQQEPLPSDSAKVDSVFSNYFNVLDSYLAKTDTDLSVRRIQIISNLERLSHIEADGDGTYVGKLVFSKKNLIDWKNWYSTNKKGLVWNNERGRVERRPIEKSIEFKFDRAVDIAVHALIEKQQEKNSQRHFYIFLTKSLSKNGCDNYKLFVESYTGEPLDYLFEIINTSPRFYIYREMPIPISVDFDFDFIDGSSKINGVLLRKSLKGSMNFIEFSRDGEVLKISN